MTSLRPVRPRWPAALLGPTAALLGCASPAPGGADAVVDGFDRSALLRHLASNVLLPRHEAAASAAAELPPALVAHCDALDAAADPAPTRAAAEAAFVAAALAWQDVDAVLVGPAAMDQRALRDRIYAWPLLATCTVDRDVVSAWATPAGYDVATRLNNARSLTAIEYLLFPPGDGHSCPTAPAGWDALGADRPRARCRLAAAIAADVAAQTAAVAQAWRADGGGYVTELAEAGAAGSGITSPQAGLNLVSDGLFYVDSMVKDMKLGETSGVVVNACGTIDAPCEREVELRFADRGTEAVRRNLASLHAVFTGRADAGDGPGFDDFLSALGAGDVAARMTAELDAAIGAAERVPPSLLTALRDQRQAVVDAHAAVKVFTDDLKSQFLTVLALDIPDDVAADND